MSAIVKKLLSRNLLNMMVIALVFGIYMIAVYLTLPIMVQLVVMAVLLLSLLKIDDDHYTT